MNLSYIYYISLDVLTNYKIYIIHEGETPLFGTSDAGPFWLSDIPDAEVWYAGCHF